MILTKCSSALAKCLCEMRGFENSTANLGGRKVIVDEHRHHHETLHRIIASPPRPNYQQKPSLQRRRPTKKKTKQQRMREFAEVEECYRRVARVTGCTDTRPPYTAGLSHRLSKCRAKKEAAVAKAHQKNLSHMHRRIRDYSSMQQRRKNPFDPKAYPAKIKRTNADLCSITGYGMPRGYSVLAHSVAAHGERQQLSQYSPRPTSAQSVRAVPRPYSAGLRRNHATIGPERPKTASGMRPYSAHRVKQASRGGQRVNRPASAAAPRRPTAHADRKRSRRPNSARNRQTSTAARASDQLRIGEIGVDGLEVLRTVLIDLIVEKRIYRRLTVLFPKNSYPHQQISSSSSAFHTPSQSFATRSLLSANHAEEPCAHFFCEPGRRGPRGTFLPCRRSCCTT